MKKLLVQLCIICLNMPVVYSSVQNSEFNQFLEEFLIPHDPKELYILIDPAEVTWQTKICLDLIKSMSRSEYVRVVDLAKDPEDMVIFGSTNYQALRKVAILVLSSSTLSIKAIEHVGYKSFRKRNQFGQHD